MTIGIGNKFRVLEQWRCAIEETEDRTETEQAWQEYYFVSVLIIIYILSLCVTGGGSQIQFCLLHLTTRSKFSLMTMTAGATAPVAPPPPVVVGTNPAMVHVTASPVSAPSQHQTPMKSSMMTASQQVQRAPPNGVAPGGEYRLIKKTGANTWSITTTVSVITCLFTLLPLGYFGLLCPCDTEEVSRRRSLSCDVAPLLDSGIQSNNHLPDPTICCSSFVAKQVYVHNGQVYELSGKLKGNINRFRFT